MASPGVESTPALGDSARLRQDAEHAASSLPPLQIAAERVAATVAQGVHGRRRVGTGETFWQFRRYQPGDSANRIDWRQSAKSQHTFIRETEWEAAQSVWLWRDASPSMNYRSNLAEDTKSARASLLLVATAALLVQGGEHVALLGHQRVARTGSSALDQLTMALTREHQAADDIPARAHLPRHGRAPRALAAMS